MPEIIRKKIRWASKKRKGSSRVWKTKVVFAVKGAAKPASKSPAKEPPKK